MLDWFKRKKTPVPETESAHDNRVEVVVHKEAAKEVVEKAKKANQDLNDLLNQNHFTIKIFIAAGGKISNKKAANHGH